MPHGEITLFKRNDGQWMLTRQPNNGSFEFWTGQLWVKTADDALVFASEEEAHEHVNLFCQVMETGP